MRRYIVAAVVFIASLAATMPFEASARGWEQLKTERPDSRHVASDSEIQVRAGRGVLYVNTTRNLNIKIYTILGSQIASDNLSPGSYQFVLPAHGVYIIKAGELTCKVAV